MKYLIIVSLILAILTIGAASASQDVVLDDGLAASDSGDDLVSAEDGGDGSGDLAADPEDPEEDDPAVDVTVYGDPIDEDDYEDDGDYIVADINAPKNATGKVAVIVDNYEDNPVFVSNLTSLVNQPDEDDPDCLCYSIYLSQLEYEFVNDTEYSILVRYFDGNYDDDYDDGTFTFGSADDQSDLEDPELYIDYDYEDDYLIGDNRGVTVQVSGQLSNNVTVLLKSVTHNFNN